MSELEAKKSEALRAINTLLSNTSPERYATIHKFNAMALDIEDALLENNAIPVIQTYSRGRGKPQERQHYYEIKVEDLRVAMGDLLEDITPIEDTIVEQEMPSYLLEEGDDE